MGGGGSRSSYSEHFERSEDLHRYRRTYDDADRRYREEEERARRARDDEEREAANRRAREAAREREAAEAETRRIEEERKRNLQKSKDKAAEEPPRTRAKAAEQSERPIRYELARNKITVPPPNATTAFVLLVDNSGSNRKIAEAIRNGAGYINAVLGAQAPHAAIAINFFSDHCDGGKLFQPVDYTMGGPEFEDILRASVARVEGADGGDSPEAIECALAEAAALDFGHIPRDKRHLILVSDVVAHRMGMSGDEGCPDQVDWRTSLLEAHEVYGSFRVVATGNRPDVLRLQKQFIASERLQYDLMDMVSGGLSVDERCRLVVNAVLFMAFCSFHLQTVENFLAGLYEKWLANPMYGSDTDRRAREQIQAFASHLEATDDQIREMLERVFGD